MTTLAEAIAKQALASIAATRTTDVGPLEKVSLNSLEAGTGLDFKDMTHTERDRKLDRDRKQRARFAKERQRQVTLADGTDVEDEQDYDGERFREAMTILGHWYKPIRLIARHHYLRVERYLTDQSNTGRGFGENDVTQELYLRLCRQVSRNSEIDMTALAESVELLLDRYKGIPDDIPRDWPKEAWWLATRANFYARIVLRTMHRKYPTLASIESLDTIYRATGGVDQFIAATKAAHAPSMSGYRFPDPDRFDPTLLAAAIAAEIEWRSLDELATLLLDEDKRNGRGFKWTEHHEDVYAALPVVYDASKPGIGRPLPPLKSWSDSTDERLYGRLARDEVREAFAWMPEFIERAVDLMLNLRIESDHKTKRYASPIIRAYVSEDDMAKVIVRAITGFFAEALA